MSAIPDQRTLYRRHEIAAAPGKPFVMLSHESAADAVEKLIGADYIATTWPDVPGGWQWADLSALVGRKGLLIPDATADARHDMQMIAARLYELGCSVRVTDPKNEPEGWTPSGFDGTREDFIAWAKPLTVDYTPPPASASEPDEEMPPAEFPPEANLTKRPKRARLQLVDGNNALAPQAEEAAAPIPLSETAFAADFAHIHGEDWRCIKEWGSWYFWDDDKWTEDRTDRRVKPMRELFTEAQNTSEALALTPSAKRALLGRKTPIYSSLILAGTYEPIAAGVDQWDLDPWRLGVPGGVLDLKTGNIQPARREDYITKRAACAPKHGDAPIWREFLETVTGGNEELIAFLQRFAGYCLTGETREQSLAFLYGTGQNGKGVFITTISNILGDYATACDADTFMESDGDRHPTDRARLRGARLVYVDETDSAKRWNEKLIKRVTGGNKIEARFMGRDFFEYMPQFKLLIAGNHKPQLRGVGKAMQRRINLVPFTVTIPDDQRDDELPKKLESEYPQIFQWMLDGCEAWLRVGLCAPAEVIEATSRYIEGEDVIGEWIEERTEQQGTTERPSAYKNYRSWAEGRGERAWSTKNFWAALEERGYIAKKSVGRFYIQGLGLRATSHEDPPFSYGER